MKLSGIFTKHFKNPKGILGSVAGKIMAHENDELYKWTFKQMDIQPKDRILEIGFGPGEGLHMLLEEYKKVKADGIDPSQTMYDQAKKRNKEFISNGQLHLMKGTAEDLFADNHTYDKIYAVNNFPLWKDRFATLQRIQSLLKIEGELVITLQPRQEEATRDQAFTYADEIQHLLMEAGLSDVKVKFKHIKPSLSICVSAKNI